MCGIVAWCPRTPVAADEVRERLQRAMRAMKHRGPDDEGVSVVTTASGLPVGIGNVRLAIQDLSPAGHQPMARGSATLVMNGEIYNHRELRAADAHDDVWQSGSDTETVLRAWQDAQTDIPTRLHGMFALAMWDQARDALFVARDRFGMKPLYVAEGEFGVVLASELRALLATGLVSATLDRDGLAGYVRFGCVPEPLTLVQGVRRMPAASAFDIREGVAGTPRTYWAPDASLDAAAPATSGADAIREALERSTREHLLSDVPVAVLLSGGIDSSIIAALAGRASPGAVTAFTVGFDDAAIDETPWAAKVATMHGLGHQVVRLSSDDVTAQLSQAVADMDMPSVDGANTWIVSRAIAEAGFKVALTGLGGDELFGGYGTFAQFERANRLAPRLGWLPTWMRARLAGGGERGARAAELVARGRTRAQRYDTLRSFWSGAGLQALGISSETTLATWTLDQATAPRVAMSALELGGYMRSMLLRDADANSMAHSLELRVPFLDHRVAEACLQMRASRHAGARPKHVLLDALGALLPAGLAERPKQGFELPMDAWMRGPLQDHVTQGLDALAPLGLQPAGITAAHQAWTQGTTTWTRVWALATLGHWARRTLAT